MGSGSKPQIHISHKSDVVLCVSSGLVLVVVPEIKIQLQADTIMQGLLLKQRHNDRLR